MPMYNLIEYSNNYSKTLGSLWQYYRDEPTLNNAGASDSFPGYKTAFKCKEKLAGSKEDNATKAVQIIAPLKYLSNFSRILQKPWNNCEIKLILRWSENCVIYNTATKQDTTFARNDTKLHVLVLTLSVDDKEKLLQQFKSGFKRTINCNKYEPKPTKQNAPNHFFNWTKFSGRKQTFCFSI